MRPRYRVFTEQYTYSLTLLGSGKAIGIPDVAFVDTRPETELEFTSPSGTSVSPVTAELPMPEETVERYLEIRDLDNGEVITAIEILSPTNKISKEGRRQYEEKRLKVLGSRTHLIEIDLLRSGEPLSMITAKNISSHYRILVSRSHQRPHGDVYFFGVREPIPDIPVPLRPGETEPILELNTMLHELYDILNFDLVIDYTEDPQPLFEGQDAEWVDELLRRQQLRG